MKKRSIQVFIIAVFLSPLLGAAAEPPAPEEGKGLVVLYRLAKAKGAAIRFNLRSSSGLSANLSNGSWLYEQLEPGKYTYWVSSPSFDGQDAITLNVSTGQTLYLKGEIKWGWPAGRTKFALVPETTGKVELAKIK